MAIGSRIQPVSSAIEITRRIDTPMRDPWSSPSSIAEGWLRAIKRQTSLTAINHPPPVRSNGRDTNKIGWDALSAAA